MKFTISREYHGDLTLIPDFDGGHQSLCGHIVPHWPAFDRLKVHVKQPSGDFVQGILQINHDEHARHQVCVHPEGMADWSVPLSHMCEIEIPMSALAERSDQPIRLSLQVDGVEGGIPTNANVKVNGLVLGINILLNNRIIPGGPKPKLSASVRPWYLIQSHDGDFIIFDWRKHSLPVIHQSASVTDLRTNFQEVGCEGSVKLFVPVARDTDHFITPGSLWVEYKADEDLA